jgi:hypothetical protein
MEKEENINYPNEDNNNRNILKKKDDDYLETLINHPLDLFNEITTDIIDIWKNKLLENETFTIIKNDSIILMKEPNHKLQNLIIIDCERTRKKEEILIPGFKKILECMLTFYCDNNNIEYKQSINEIFAPLILMKYKIPNLTYIEIYNIAESIINIYLPNYYIDPVDINQNTYEIIDKQKIKNSNKKSEKFFPLIPSLELFNLLLKYHEPAIFNLFDKCNIDSKLYAMKWFMTCFFLDLKLNILYTFIDYLILINDNLFLHYFLVALLKVNRDKIFNIKDKMKYLQFLTQLTINTNEELIEVISTAIDLRDLTPYSFRILTNKLGIFQKKIPIEILIKKFKIFSFNNLIITIPIFPMEIFYITYKEEIKCPDKYCKKNIELRLKIENNKKKIIQNNNNYKTNYICEHCDMKIIKNKIKYILVDLRILEYGDFSDENIKTGFLPNMIMVNQDELKSEDFPEILSQRFKPNRGNFHFIFITSETKFSKLENFYEEEKNEEDLDKKYEMIFGGGGFEEKNEKILNLNKIVNKLDKKEIFKLKEFDIFKLILKSLLQENYPYISFVYGGYNSIHKYSFLYDIQLLDHEIKNCILCQSQNKKSENKKENQNNDTILKLWEHKKKFKYNYIDELSKIQENFINFCILREINGKKIDDERIQIIICLIFKDYKIEIYKIERKKIYEDNNNTESKEIIDKTKYYDLGKENKKENKEPELTLILTLNINEIIKISRDKNKKNVVTIEYFTNQNILNLQKFIIDFANKDDSKNLIKNFKKMVEKFKLKKREEL